MDGVVAIIQKEKSELGYSPTLERLWEIDYERKPVSIREFVESDEYLGQSTKDLQEVWKKELDEIFAPSSTITTLIFTGAIGTGKTTVATICLAYKIYQLSCLRDPAEFYGLLPGSKIVFGCFNITLTKADVGYDLLKNYVDISPYFSKYCPRCKRPDEPIWFPSKRIRYDIGSLASHALGENLLGFMIDEANFFKRNPDDSQKTRAHQLYTEAQTRLISRYMRYGVVPGLVIVISSRKTQTSFLEEKMKKLESDPDLRKTTKVVSFSLWETKPKEIFSGKKFQVAVGDEIRSSRILEEDEIVTDQKVIEVPIEYRAAFSEDIEGALMNIAGVSVTGAHSFFQSRSSVYACVDPKRRHPFDCEEITDVVFNPRVVGHNKEKEKKILDHLSIKNLCIVQGSKWALRDSPGSLRYVHIDQAITNEACGMSMGRLDIDEKGDYRIVYDFILRLKAPLGFEVDLEQISQFILDLKGMGVCFGAVTFDRYESRTAIQRLMKAGVKSHLLSITLEHYKIFRKLLSEQRVLYYHYEPLIREILEIRRDEDSDKRPHHPTGGFDDVIDSVVGVCAHCSGAVKGSSKVIDLYPKVSRGPILIG